jgi:hypothetical protein
MNPMKEKAHVQARYGGATSSMRFPPGATAPRRRGPRPGPRFRSSPLRWAAAVAHGLASVILAALTVALLRYPPTGGGGDGGGSDVMDACGDVELYTGCPGDDCFGVTPTA